MSEATAIITLRKEKHTPGSEDYTFGNVKCPHCNGKCGSYKEIGRDDHSWEECEKCDGAGKFTAIVSVKWIPDFN